MLSFLIESFDLKKGGPTMRSNKKIIKTVAVIILLISNQGHSKPTPPLHTFFEEVMDTFNTMTEIPTEAPATTWFLQSVWFRLQARTGFEIPGIFNVKIVPEAEIVIQRLPPQDLAPYP
jgi:hypothetical protein